LENSYFRHVKSETITLQKIKGRFLFYFLILFITSAAAKDKVTYGFERLAIHDYFNARESFLESVKKQPAPACYGISIISSIKNNPFYNLDTARVYILKAEAEYRHLTPDEETKIKEKYNVDAYRISQQKDSVALLAYAEAELNPTITSWNTFIENYNWSGWSDSATVRRNELAFAEVKKQNSSKSYQEFISQYPNSLQVPEAKKRYDDRLFREETSAGTEAAYSSFINNYPDSPYKMQAEDSLYAVTTSTKTPASYYSFARKYPDNKNNSTAWMRLYHSYIDVSRPKDLETFFKLYPDFKFRKQVEEDFSLLNVNMLPVKYNNQFTFVTEEGKQLIPNLYDDVDEFSEGVCAVSRNGKYGYIRKSGKVEINFLFDEAEPFENGFALVKSGGKETIINREGEMLFSPRSGELGLPHDERILVEDSEHYDYLDLRGKIVIPAKFETANDFSGGLAVAGKEDSLGIIDRNGQWILPAKYSSIQVLDNNLIKVELDESFGLLNRLGDEVLPAQYDEIGKFSSGLALISKDEKFGYTDVTGKIVIPMQYDFDNQSLDRSEFKSGYAEVKLNGKSALIDSLGNKIIPAIYDDLFFFKPDQPIAARKKTKWGYIDLDNKTVIPFKYDHASIFSEGLAAVKTGKLFGVIDSAGNKIVPPAYESISPYKNGVSITKNDTGFGLISKTGLVLIENGYEKYNWATDIVIRFERSGRYGYFNTIRREWIWKEDGL
jgi:hypothetical protein